MVPNILIILAIISGGVFFLRMIAKSKKRTEASEQEMLIRRRLEAAMSNFMTSLRSLNKLNERYCIEDYVDEVTDERQGIDDGVRSGRLSANMATDAYRRLVLQVDRSVTNPEKQFTRKYYDFLDDSLLKEPVNLKINHSEMGEVIVKVNRRNAEKYIKNPRHFHLKSKRDSSHRYLVRSGNSVVRDGYYRMYDDDFGVLDYVILYSLLCDNSDVPGYIGDAGFAGFGDGQFNGAGASGDYGASTETVQSSDHEMSGDSDFTDVAVEATVASVIIDDGMGHNGFNDLNSDPDVASHNFGGRTDDSDFEAGGYDADSSGSNESDSGSDCSSDCGGDGGGGD